MSTITSSHPEYDSASAARTNQSQSSSSIPPANLSVTIQDEDGVRVYNLETNTGDKELIAAPLTTTSMCLSPTSFWSGAQSLFGEERGQEENRDSSPDAGEHCVPPPATTFALVPPLDPAAGTVQSGQPVSIGLDALFTSSGSTSSQPLASLLGQQAQPSGTQSTTQTNPEEPAAQDGQDKVPPAPADDIDSIFNDEEAPPPPDDDEFAHDDEAPPPPPPEDDVLLNPRTRPAGHSTSRGPPPPLPQKRVTISRQSAASMSNPSSQSTGSVIQPLVVETVSTVTPVTQAESKAVEGETVATAPGQARRETKTESSAPTISNTGTGVLRPDLVPIGSAAAAAAGSNASATYIGANYSASHHVSNVKRVAHVTYDPETGTFSGVPEEWEGELRKAFGLPLQLTISRVVPGYESRLPPLLCDLRARLTELGGLESEGIFRVSPDINTVLEAKEKLNRGEALECTDVNVIAQLIKMWFREMPGKILDTLPEEDVYSCRTPQRAGEIVMAGREPHRTLFLWLLDLCCDVSIRGQSNLMGPKSIAIVLAPNLSRIADPALAPPTDLADIQRRMDLCKLQTLFFELAIWWRMHVESRPGYNPDTVLPIPVAYR